MAMSRYMCNRGIVRFQRSFSVLRHRVRSFSSLVAEPDAEPDTVQYPPIKPRWPPGSWGGMTEVEAWKKWDKKVELETQSLSIKERLDIVSPQAQLSWEFPAIQRYPEGLHYQQDITKTCLLNGMPEYYETLEEEAVACLSTVRSKVEEGLILEKDLLDRSNIQFEYPKNHLKNFYTRSQLINCLITSLAADYPHLRTCQFGEDVQVKAFWDRHGFPNTAEIFQSDTEEKSQTSMKGKMDSRFHTEFTCTQLRSELPLKPVSFCCVYSFSYYYLDLLFDTIFHFKI